MRKYSLSFSHKAYSCGVVFVSTQSGTEPSDEYGSEKSCVADFIVPSCPHDMKGQERRMKNIIAFKDIIYRRIFAVTCSGKSSDVSLLLLLRRYLNVPEQLIITAVV